MKLSLDVNVFVEFVASYLGEKYARLEIVGNSTFVRN